MMFLRMSVVPPSIELARERRKLYSQAPLAGACSEPRLERRVGALDVERQLGDPLVDVGPLPLAERALGAGDAGLHRLGQAAVGVEAHRLGLDVELGDPLAEDRVLGRGAAVDAGLGGQRSSAS